MGAETLQILGAPRGTDLSLSFLQFRISGEFLVSIVELTMLLEKLTQSMLFECESNIIYS